MADQCEALRLEAEAHPQGRKHSCVFISAASALVFIGAVGAVAIVMISSYGYDSRGAKPRDGGD